MPWGRDALVAMLLHTPSLRLLHRSNAASLMPYMQTLSRALVASFGNNVLLLMDMIASLAKIERGRSKKIFIRIKLASKRAPWLLARS